MFDEVAGFGQLQQFFDDPTIEEIWINEPGRVFIARRGRSELTTVILTAEQVADLVERMLRISGRRLDLSQPFVDAQLPDGSRLHVVIPNITRRHLAVNVRKFVISVSGLAELVRLGTLTEPRRPVPGGLGRRRVEHPGLRRHPGRQDHPAQRACARPSPPPNG